MAFFLHGNPLIFSVETVAPIWNDNQSPYRHMKVRRHPGSNKIQRNTFLEKYPQSSCNSMRCRSGGLNKLRPNAPAYNWFLKFSCWLRPLIATCRLATRRVVVKTRVLISVPTQLLATCLTNLNHQPHTFLRPWECPREKNKFDFKNITLTRRQKRKDKSNWERR